ncbi:3-methyl-2-oxobutanoate hydroxymethyltransferase [Halobellus rarus]|uniref:3-methyl-2-oxobutanoate hydroxymethyltransferase n=1 Tax=Halobellus rarus TaxID=1126237 RepID=A0ABD6CP03_9EURY|nr:3-methyl-2-oxobutanoate hydroxymethyltransferase [Halobellus rarus]
MTTVASIQEQETPVTMLTAYDAPTAALADEAGIDVVLVGDSIGNAVFGYESTLPVTLDDMMRATTSVANAVDDALVVTDLPFLSYGVDRSESLENAGRLLKEAGAHAVKLESGPHTIELTEAMTRLGIPVMAHVGLTPQHVNSVGGYTRQGTTAEQAAEMLDLAKAHEEAGAFSLVIEHVPREVGAAASDELEIPAIGIGAGPETDGQVLVVDDAIGLSERIPPFAEAFGDVRGEMRQAIEQYRDAVESREFPADEHSHSEGLDI